LGSIALRAVPIVNIQAKQNPIGWETISHNDLNPADQNVARFGDVGLGSSADKTFRFRNLGTDPLTISGAASSNPQYTFRESDGTPLPPTVLVAAGSEIEFRIRFTPSAGSSSQSTISFATNDPIFRTYRFALSGVGRGPEIRMGGKPGASAGYDNITDGETTVKVSEGTDFGDFPLAGGYVTHYFKITNDGNAGLAISNARLSGSGASHFSIRNLSTLTNIGAGNTREFEIRFDPSSAGTKIATFLIDNNDLDEDPYSFRLRGNATTFPEIGFDGRRVGGSFTDIADNDGTPSSGDGTLFVDTVVGGSNNSEFRINNTGNAPLSLETPVLGGADAGQFHILPLVTSDLAAGESRSFYIRFRPTGPGTKTATFSMGNGDNSENPFNFTLRGTALAPDARISGRPGNSGSYDNIVSGETVPRTSEGTLFVVTPVGSFTERFFKLTNDGNTALDPVDAFMSGADKDQFAVRGLSLADLAGGEFREFEIRFTPTSTGIKTATFNLVSSDPDENPYTFVVQAEAVAFPSIRVRGEAAGGLSHPDIEDGDLNPDQDVTRYGEVELGRTGARTFRIENEGNAALDITSITSTNARFTIPGPPAAVPAGGHRDFVISFAPTSRGVETGIISIRSNTPGDEDPYTFALTGTGAGPEIVVEWENRGFFTNVADGSRADSRLGTVFGDAKVSNDSANRLFRITNSGDKNLRITARDFTGSGGSHFSVAGLLAGNPFAEIGPGKSRTFTITFDPSSAGTKVATFTMDTNDADEDPYDFQVVGTGVAEPDISVAGITEAGALRIPTAIADNDLVPDQDVTIYGSVTPGESGYRLFRIANNGDAPLDITSIASSNPLFTIPGPPSSVDPGDHIDFVINFQPLATGIEDTVITIESNDPDSGSIYDFALTGNANGPEIMVEGNINVLNTTPVEILDGQSNPSSEAGTDLGSGNVGSSGGFRLFRITNTGNQNLRITSREFTGSGREHFTVQGLLGPLGRTIQPGENHVFRIYFEPTSPGSKLATFSMATNDGDEDPFEFQVKGTAVQEPEIRVWGPKPGFDPLDPWREIFNTDTIPSADDGTSFAALAVAGGSETRRFRIRNESEAVLSISSITTTLPVHFGILNAPSVVPAGAEETFDLVFDPAAEGRHDADLVIVSDAWNPSGTAANFRFAITGYGWDNVSPRIRVGGQFNDELRSEDSPASWVGSILRFPVNNDAVNYYPFWHSIEHDDPDTGNLNGTNFASVNLDPQFLLDFNEQTETSYFRIWNEGAEVLIVDGMEVNSSQYQIDPTFYRGSAPNPLYLGSTVSIGPGEHITFSVTFAPRLYGRHNAEVRISSNASNEDPFVIRVTGFADNNESGPEIRIGGSRGWDRFRAEPGETRTRTATVYNLGNEILTLANPVSSHPARFEVLDMPTMLAPGGTGDLVIAYHAGDQDVEATISIDTNDPDDGENPKIIRLEGVPDVPILRVRTSSSQEIIPNGQATPEEEFDTEFGLAGPIEGGTFASVKTYELRNFDDAATLHISAIDTGSPHFIITDAPSLVGPGDSALLTIEFNPSEGGRIGSMLRIYSDDPDGSPYEFAIGGDSTGASPELEILALEPVGGFPGSRWLRISYRAPAGRTYRVMKSANLRIWHPMPGQNGLPGGPSQSRYLEAGIEELDSLYFRIEEE
jgi:hypothetical protein